MIPIQEKIERSFKIMWDNITEIERTGDGGVDPMDIFFVDETINQLNESNQFQAQKEILQAWVDDRIIPVKVAGKIRG